MVHAIAVVSSRTRRLRVLSFTLTTLAIALSGSSIARAQVALIGTQPVNFGSANVCQSGQTTPVPCSQTLTLTYRFSAEATVGNIAILTQGAPNLDFRAKADDTSASLCRATTYSAGATCTVDVTFTPLAPGQRKGAVELLDGSGNLLVRTLVYGAGTATGTATGPSIGFNPSGRKTLAAGFQLPGALAVDGAGDLFVVDENTRRLSEIVAVNGSIPDSPQILIICPNCFQNPWDVAIDGAGDLFVSDLVIGIKEVVAVNGKFPATPTVLTFPIAEGSSLAEGLAVDAAGDVFVADGDNNNVKELEAVNGSIPSSPTIRVLGSGFTDPSDVAVDAAGDVFVIDNDLVRNATRINEIVAVNGSIPTNPVIRVLTEDLLSAYSIALDAAGDIFVTNLAGQGTVNEILAVNGSVPDNPTIVNLTSGGYFLGIALDANDNLFITNCGTGDECPQDDNAPVQEIVRSQPPPLIFGSVALNSKTTLPLTIANTGGGTLTFTPSFNDTAFSVASEDDTCSTGITSAQTCTLQIQFAPTAAGVQHGVLTLQTNGATNPGVSLEGTVLPPGIDFGGPAVQVNGTAAPDGNQLDLTSGGANQKGSAFTATPMNIQSFTTDFTFQIADPKADGFTFTIQNDGPGAIGHPGGSLGYAGIKKSVAVKFDLFNNAGEGSNSTGLYVDGAAPTVPSKTLDPGPIDLHSGHAIHAHLTYDGLNVTLTLTDYLTQATWSSTFPVDIPATVGGNTAYVGFTGATGAETSAITISSWTYAAGPPAPNYPTGFDAVGMILNGQAAQLLGDMPLDATLTLTNGRPNHKSSAYYEPVQNVQSFTTDFNFQLYDPSAVNPMADGITFVIQNAGSGALGHSGGSLGYAGIRRSVALKFDLFNNSGEGPNSTGIYVNGEQPTLPAVDLGPAVDLHTGDPMDAHITYDGTTLSLALTDTVTLGTTTHSWPINIPAAVGGNTAYVGFTAGTGEMGAEQRIYRWTYLPGPP